METPPTKTTHLSEEILMEIVARLPLRSISRFKSVSKTWKSTLESSYFRRLFVSLHKNSSSSWSLMRSSKSKELIGFYGCETWDLRKSLASFIPLSFKSTPQFKHVSSSNELVLIEEECEECKSSCGNVFYVGNPVLQQWIQIPPPPVDYSWCFLVTRVDDDGVVLSFKVVTLSSVQVGKGDSLSMSLYSSDTGIWSSKNILYPYHIINLNFMTMNGTIYLSLLTEPGVFLAHDFYSESDQFRVLHYPDHPSDNNPELIRALTTSGGFVMYMKTLAQEEETGLKVWRLNNDDTWQLLWEIGLLIIGNYVPMAMHPFDSCIMYLWNIQNRRLVTCNLKKRNYRILSDNEDHQDCVINQPACEKYMDEIWGSRSSVWDYAPFVDVLFQFVLPRWAESMPCPPEVEMIDTTSLLSYMHKTRKRNRGEDDYEFMSHYDDYF